MARLKTITTQFIDGEPNGVRIMQRKLSAITTVIVPRPFLARAKELKGLSQSGVYFLINDEDGAISKIYVGQTTQGILRLDDHNAHKDFWNKAILFLGDSRIFTLDTISALEKYAIERAQASNRYKVENKANPKYCIDQYDLPIIEEIYDEIGFIMASLGYDMGNESETATSEKIFHTSRRGIQASGVYRGERFDVLAGSRVDVDTIPKIHTYKTMREDLVKDGSLSQGDDGFWRLAKTLSFKTPSGASDFVLGGSINGWREWKDKDGKTLDELYRK